MRQIFGIVLWALGVFLYGLSLWRRYADASWPDDNSTAIAIVFVIWAGILIYSWLFASNAGHRAHLYNILFFDILSLATLLVRWGYIGVWPYVVAVAGVVAGMTASFIRFRKDLYQNYFKNR